MDLVIILLLLFGERMLNAMVGGSISEGRFDLEKVSDFGAIMLIAGFVIGLPAFFYGPEGRMHRLKGFLPWAGVWINATGITLMGVTGILVLLGFHHNDPYTGETTTLEIIITLLLFLVFIILPLILMNYYADRLMKRKCMSPTIRSLLLVPLVIFSSAYLNEVIRTSIDNNIAFLTFLISFSIFFVPYFIAPRWFALGDNRHSNKVKWWLLRYVLFACAAYFQI